MTPRLKLLTIFLIGTFLFSFWILLKLKHHPSLLVRPTSHHQQSFVQYYSSGNRSRSMIHLLSHPKKREQLWVDPYSSEYTKEHMLIRRVGYIDDRFSDPFIVLIAMHNDRVWNHNYFARITYHSNDSSTEEHQCLPLEYWMRNGNLNLKHNLPEIYVNYILRTKGSLLKGRDPVRLTVAHNCKYGRESEDITIWDSKRSKRPVKYGVCLHKGLFNIKDPQLLVDWIEIHKALGVESITVYLEDVTEAIASTVQPYVDEGLVDILDWKLDKVTRDYGQSGVMTECHYMNMYSVQYLGTYDLDEIIVPVKHKLWEEMFKEISKNDPNFDDYASFVFRGLRWHDGHKNKTIHSETCAKAKVPFYFRKTIRDDAPHDHPKIIIRPLLTLKVQVHGIEKCMKGRIKEMNVNRTIATCHHYRVPDSIEGRNVTHDSLISRYKDSVFNGIKRTLC